MTDVPEDIQKAAREIACAFFPQSTHADLRAGRFDTAATVKAACSALLAERERFQICGYQRRLKWQTPEAEWLACPAREATDRFESVPSFEYRPIYAAIRSPDHD